jgi:hypothetical protein
MKTFCYVLLVGLLLGACGSDTEEPNIQVECSSAVYSFYAGGCALFTANGEMSAYLADSALCYFEFGNTCQCESKLKWWIRCIDGLQDGDQCNSCDGELLSYTGCAQYCY